MTREHESIKAGLFVLAGIVLTGVVVFVLSDLDKLFEKRQEVKVYYGLGDGLLGLKEGASVTLGDQPIGQVVRITDQVEPTDDTGGARVVGKILTATIPRRYRLYQDAVIELNAPLIGSGTALNIRSVGIGEPYTGDPPILGGVAGSTQVKELVRETGIQELQRQQIRNIIANIESITTTLREDVPSIMSSAKKIMTDSRVITAQLKSTSEVIATSAKGLGDRSTQWMDRMDRATASADEALADMRDLVHDKAPVVRETLDHIHSIAQTAREKTMAQVGDALDAAVAALDNFKTTSQEVLAFVVGQRPVLERSLANAQLASDQLKLTMIEVRRAPWRLLYEPDDKELNTDNLYDAARSFALAAGLLDSSTETLRAMVDQHAIDDQQVAKVLKHLEAMFATFEVAETAFWKELKVDPKAQ